MQPAMSAFLVEGYAPSTTAESLQSLATSLIEAAEATPTRGRVRHVQSSVVPGDEMCLCLLEGPSPEAVWEVAERAGIQVTRVSEALHVTGELETGEPHWTMTERRDPQ